MSSPEVENVDLVTSDALGWRLHVVSVFVGIENWLLLGLYIFINFCLSSFYR